MKTTVIAALFISSLLMGACGPDALSGEDGGSNISDAGFSPDGGQGDGGGIADAGPTEDGGANDGGLPDDGGSGDGGQISDGGSTVSVRIETWTLNSDGQTTRELTGAQVRVDNQYETPRCNTPCNVELETGNHALYLSLSGWVQGPHPLNFQLSQSAIAVNQIPTTIVQTNGLTVRHRLDRDLTGTWQRDGTTTTYTVFMESIWPPDTISCPDSLVGTGFGSFLCVDGESLSICKTRANECEYFIENGEITDNATKVTYSICRVDSPMSCGTGVFLKDQ